MKNKRRESVSSIFGELHVSYSLPAWLRELFRRASGAFSPSRRRGAEGALGAARKGEASASSPSPRRGLGSWLDFSNRGRSLLAYGLLALGGFGLFSLLPARERVDFRVQAPGIRGEKDEAPPPLILVFDAPVAALELVGKTLEAGARLDPPLPGSWSWIDDRELAFYPRADWPIGTDYRFEFDAAIFSDLVKLRRRSDSFSTPSFTASLVGQELYINPTDPREIRARAEFSFSYPVDREAFKAAVSAKEDYVLSFDEKGLAAYLVSSPLAVKDEAYEVKLRVRGGYGPAATGTPFREALEALIRVPGRYESAFVQDAATSLLRDESYAYRRVLSFETSLGIAPERLGSSLAVYLLPRDRKEAPGVEAEAEHEWNLAEVDAALLASSQRLELEAQPIEGSFSSTLSFLFDAPSKRSIYVKLPGELEFAGGFRSRKPFERVLALEPIPKEVRIMYEGSILSLGGERRISLYANDVENVIFEVGRIIPDQVNHFVSQTAGDYSSPSFENWDFGLENISAIRTETRALRKLEPGKVQYFSFDFNRYLEAEADPRLRYGLFYLKVSEYDPERKAATRIGSRRFVLVTDLGILVKRNDQVGYDFFVQSVRSGRPVADARVEVIGKNGLAVHGVETDATGHAFIPRLDGFVREKSPEVFVVKKGSDMSFLPVEGRGRFLNYSRFEVGGVHGTADPGFIDAYLFSDRGLYRPGDEARVGIVVKAGSWEKDLAGLPLELGVEDPRGVEILRRPLRLSASGFEEFSWRSLESAPTGKYEIKLYLVRDKDERRLLGSTSVKVEEYRPDRLSIKARILEDKGLAWVSPQTLHAELGLMNLYGTPAVGNAVRGRLVLRPGSPSLREYRDYRFADPFVAEKSFEQELGEAATDAEGKVVFPLDLGRFEKASYLLTVSAEGREKEGGRGVSTDASVLVSPLEAIVGYKADGELSYVPRGSARAIGFIAVSPERKRVGLAGLSLRIDEARFVSVLEKGADGLFHYRSVEKIIPVLTRDFSIAEKGSRLELPTAEAGEFILSLTDAAGLKLASLRYSVAGTGNLARSLDKNAELQVRLDRGDYAPGDTISVNVVAPYTGSGLITIERDKVYAWAWFRAETNASVQTITVPANLEGSAYVNVSFLRSIDSREIHASPLSYGVAPFSVSRERRSNPVELRLPAEIKSGSRLSIGYKSAAKGRIVVFGVDEGILQVAKYKSPAPLDHFFRKRALEVASLQILDLLLPEYSIIQEFSATGGDDDGPGRNINPFKRKNKPPVAFWSGILPSDGTERRVEYEVPDWFNGTIRVFAVVVSEEAVGTAEDRVVARSDFVITPNVPTVLGPGDSFEVGVSIMDDLRAEGPAEVSLSLSASPEFEILGESSASLSMRRGEETTRFFRLGVRNRLGSGSIRFTAAGGGASSSVEESVSIRPATPYRVELSSGTLSGGEREIPLGRKLHPEFASVKAIASYLPTSLGLGLKDYLDSYPYGCTEQILSRAFPAVALKGAPDIGIGEKEALEAFNLAQSVIAARQSASGNVGLWSARDRGSAFVTAYALHFLTEAREAGLPVDPGLLSAGLCALRAIAEGGEGSAYADPRSAAYAIYVLSRNGVVTTSSIGALLGSKNLPKDWRRGPVAAYLAGAYALLKQEGEAARLLDSAFSGRGGEEDPFYTKLASASLCLYISSTQLPGGSAGIAAKALESIAASIGEADFNTLSSSYAVLALAAYARLSAREAPGSTAILAKDGGGAWSALKTRGGALLSAEPPLGSAAVKFAESSGRTLYYQVLQSGFDLAPPAEAERRGIEILREYTDASGKPLRALRLGEELQVHIKARTTDPARKLIPDVAIVDLFPSGFELAETPDGEGPLGSGSLAPSFVEPREDRLLVFCELTESAREFVYRLKPTLPGSFSLPPAFAESMSDRRLWALSPMGGRLEVAAPGP